MKSFFFQTFLSPTQRLTTLTHVAIVIVQRCSIFTVKHVV